MSIKFTSDSIFDIYVKKYLVENVNFSIKADIEKSISFIKYFLIYISKTSKDLNLILI